jgi:hypothetical protein
MDQQSLQYIKDNYGLISYKEMGLFLHISPSTIKKAAIRNGIANKKSKNDIPWTKEEIQILINNYGRIKYEDIHKLIPNHSIGSIAGKAKKLNVTSKEVAAQLKSKLLKNKTVFSNENFFSNPNLLNSYWAGFLAADGNIDKTNSKLALQISQKDLDHLKLLANTLEFTGKVSIYTRKTGIESCQFSITSKKICEDLKNNFNITPQKTFTLKFPTHLPLELQKAFCVGYIDGDGCITKRKYYNYCSINVIGNYNFLLDFRNLYNTLLPKELEIVSNITKKNNVFQLTVGGKIKSSILIEEFLKLEVPKLYRKWEGKINE